MKLRIVKCTKCKSTVATNKSFTANGKEYCSLQCMVDHDKSKSKKKK